METKIYLVEQPDGKYAEEACLTSTVKVLGDETTEVCPCCGAWVNGRGWLRPRSIVLTNRNIPDFFYIWGANVPFLLSERALRVIREAGLTGIKNVEPIDDARFLRKSKKEVEIPQYYHFEVERSMITMDQERSIIGYGTLLDEDRICPLCDPYGRTKNAHYGVSFHMEGYEGYDVFYTIDNGSLLFVSQRFVDVCRENGLTNLHVCPVQDWGKEAWKLFGQDQWDLWFSREIDPREFEL